MRLFWIFIAVFLGTNVYSEELALTPYRGAEIVKSLKVDMGDVEIPLAKIYRSGRGWEPEKVQVVEGQAVKTLYKIGRNVPIESVESHYETAIKSLQDSQILFSCHSRACGSSNAWANNFFNDYLLYGADSSQSLWVLQNQEGYWVIYLNRRGAGDIMVRVDQILPKTTQADERILAQLNVTDLPRIRAFLSGIDDYVGLIAFVTSDAGTQGAIAIGDQYIEEIQRGLNPDEREQIRFINLADMGKSEFGAHRVIFVRQALK